MSNDIKMSGNKGEWSELYVFLRLLSEGRVYAANERVEKIADVYYPIRKIMREETPGEVIDYVILDDSVDVSKKTGNVLTISRADFGKHADALFNELLVRKGGSFELERIARFANGIEVTKLKAPSKDKADIQMEIADIYTGYVREVGFSIKSEIGNSPTLLNAGETTNFIYRVEGISAEQADEINAIETKNKIKDRMARIHELGGIVSYFGMNNTVFRRNLILIDTLMPDIIGNLLLYYYQTDESYSCDLVRLLGKRDPIGYKDERIYEYKYRKFLCACALGLRPGSVWNGKDEATGGYIIVTHNGEVLAYSIYNRDSFEKYLLDNTKLERASTTRHKYMKLYIENGQMYLKLNLQVRFS